MKLIWLALLISFGALGEVNFDRTSQELLVTVHIFDSKSEMHKTLVEKGYKQLKYSNGGITIVYKNSNKCEIFAVKPKQLNDKKVTTLGHELLHCLYGEYHSNDVR